MDELDIGFGEETNKVIAAARKCNLDTPTWRINELLIQVSDIAIGVALDKKYWVHDAAERIENRLFTLLSIKHNKNKFLLSVIIALLGWGLSAILVYLKLSTPPC